MDDSDSSDSYKLDVVDSSDDEQLLSNLVSQPGNHEICKYPIWPSNISSSDPKRIICTKHIDRQELINSCSDAFPVEYLYLLSWPTINDSNLKSRPDLYYLLYTKQTTVEKLIAKAIAIICLHWANDFSESNRPLLRDITMELLKSDNVGSRKDPTKKICRIVFGIYYTDENCSLSRNRKIKKSMRVIVKADESDKKFEMRIIKAHDNYCELAIKCSVEREFEILELSDVTVSIYEVLQEFVSTSMLNSIEGMKLGFLNQIIIPNPNFEETYEAYLQRKNDEMGLFMQRYSISRSLTPSQRDAVFAICNKEHKQFPFVLFGPPGTGKTYTISQAIQTILKMKIENRVLICTASNMASDRVAEQLMQDFGSILTRDNVLRMMSPGKDYYLRDRQFDDIFFSDPDTEMFAIPSSFEQWRVVICTLGSSAHITYADDDMRGFFSHIMIDEAGQAFDAEIWIPIGGLATSQTSVILCGDPKQLGPVTTLDISHELKGRFGSPLLRYMEMQEYRTDKRLCCQLVDCFRCPAALTSIISSLFYDGALKSTKREFENFDYTGLDMPKSPILFIDVSSEEMQQPNGKSYGNPVEADICVHYMNLFINRMRVAPKNIGVISPYKYQQTVIRNQMVKKLKMVPGLDETAVDSVERFQGSERDVIIMSTTRTTGLGFMADDLRVNTSLTRAKKQLIVIGNEYALRKHSSWRRFILYCKEHGYYRQWDHDPGIDDTINQIIDLTI